MRISVCMSVSFKSMICDVSIVKATLIAQNVQHAEHVLFILSLKGTSDIGFGSKSGQQLNFYSSRSEFSTMMSGRIFIVHACSPTETRRLRLLGNESIWQTPC